MITWNYMLGEMNLWEVGHYDKDDWVCVAHFKDKADAARKTAEYNNYERKKHLDDLISQKVRSLGNG